MPELNLADALQRGIGSRLDRRFAGVHRRIYLALALLILALAATGSRCGRLRGLKATLAQAKVEADTIRERLARLDEHRAPATTAGTRAATDQTPQLGAIDEKLDRNLAAGVRAVQAIADHRVLLDKLAVKLDENLAETKRAVEETIVRANRN